MTRARLIDLHNELTEKAKALMLAKNADYTGGGDTFANFAAASIFGVHPIQGALIRMTDKLQRVNSFVAQGLEVKTETVEDTLVDLINYSVLVAGMIEDELQKREDAGLQPLQDLLVNGHK